MKLPDLRKALRVDVIGPDCSVYEPEDARSEFQKRHSLNADGTVRVEHVQTAREAFLDDSRSASFHFATEEERRAYTVTHADVGKLAFQEDNSKLYILIAIDTTERISKGAGTWQEVVT
jgi:hypothetical protein